MTARPRCGKPVAIYEKPGNVTTGKYDRVAGLIRGARLARGLTQDQLAAAVGVHGRKVISEWETGQAYPRKGTTRLQEVLGIDLGGPLCGRPEGHRGNCKSAAALARRYEADGARIVRARRDRGRQYGRVRDAGISVTRKAAT